MDDAKDGAKTRAAHLVAITKVCEQGYADAARDGYADNPAVIAAVERLKKAHAALVAADTDLSAKSAGIGFLNFAGLFRVASAVWRSHCALREAGTAYVGLRTAVRKHGEENLRQMGFDDALISKMKTVAQRL